MKKRIGATTLLGLLVFFTLAVEGWNLHLLVRAAEEREEAIAKRDRARSNLDGYAHFGRLTMGLAGALLLFLPPAYAVLRRRKTEDEEGTFFGLSVTLLSAWLILLLLLAGRLFGVHFR